MEILLGFQVIMFCKIFIPIYTFDALLCQNWSFLPPSFTLDNQNFGLINILPPKKFFFQKFDKIEKYILIHAKMVKVLR